MWDWSCTKTVTTWWRDEEYVFFAYSVLYPKTPFFPWFARSISWGQRSSTTPWASPCSLSAWVAWQDLLWQVRGLTSWKTFSHSCANPFFCVYRHGVTVLKWTQYTCVCVCVLQSIKVSNCRWVNGGCWGSYFHAVPSSLPSCLCASGPYGGWTLNTLPIGPSMPPGTFGWQKKKF